MHPCARKLKKGRVFNIICWSNCVCDETCMASGEVISLWANWCAILEEAASLTCFLTTVTAWRSWKPIVDLKPLVEYHSSRIGCGELSSFRIVIARMLDALFLRNHPSFLLKDVSRTGWFLESSCLKWWDCYWHWEQLRVCWLIVIGNCAYHLEKILFSLQILYLVSRVFIWTLYKEVFHVDSNI